MSKRYIQNCTGDNCSSKNKSENKLLLRAIFYFLLIIFIAETIYVLLFSPYLQINNVKITGNEELSQQDIEQVIEGSLKRKFIGIIPGDNFLFFSQDKIENLLKDNFKKIRSVEIEKKFPGSATVTIKERKALLVWCSSGDKCYLIDESGTAYNEADFNSPELVQNHLLKINDYQDNEKVAIGDKVMEDGYEQYVLSIKDSLKNLGLDISDEYSTPSRMADEINVKTTLGFDIKFSTQFSLEKALRTLAVVLKKEIPQDQRVNLAYIDLRIENEAFYKTNTSDEQSQIQEE